MSNTGHVEVHEDRENARAFLGVAVGIQRVSEELLSQRLRHRARAERRDRKPLQRRGRVAAPRAAQRQHGRVYAVERLRPPAFGHLGIEVDITLLLLVAGKRVQDDRLLRAGCDEHLAQRDEQFVPEDAGVLRCLRGIEDSPRLVAALHVQTCGL